MSAGIRNLVDAPRNESADDHVSHDGIEAGDFDLVVAKSDERSDAEKSNEGLGIAGHGIPFLELVV